MMTLKINGIEYNLNETDRVEVFDNEKEILTFNKNNFTVKQFDNQNRLFYKNENNTNRFYISHDHKNNIKFSLMLIDKIEYSDYYTNDEQIISTQKKLI